jgi:PAS domain S-box-containing protein
MTFRRRLYLAQVPLAAALLLVGLAALRTVSSLGDASQSILKDNYRSALAALRMASALDRLDRDALLRASGRAPVEPASAHRTRFDAELRVESANITEPGEAGAARRLVGAWERYQQTYDASLAAPDPLVAYLGPLTESSDAVRAAAEAIVALNQAAMVHRSDEARLTAHRLLLFMGTSTLVALALGFVASASVTANVLRPLSTLTRAVRGFGEGRLGARVRPRGDDEIADLGREFDTMADRLEQYRRSTLGELLQAQEAAQAAIDSLPDPVIILDAAGAVLNLNQAAESLLGLGPEQGLDAPLPALEPALRERIEAACAHVLGGEGPYVPRGFDEAVRVDRADGPRRLLPRATALRSAERAVTGVAIVLQDVTRLVRIDELRNDLVSTVAHEFRTPLTSLQMAIHLCAEGAAGPLTAGQADLIAGASQDCDRLQAIVEDILDLSRIRAGRIALRTGPADAAAVLARAVSDVEGPARAKGVAIEVDASRGALPVLVDAERIHVVLENLLGNAVRHTKASGRIVARVVRDGASVRFEVVDTGPGIPPQHLEHVFERFYQVPQHAAGGLGLGLFISREIVQAHGGEMGVDSVEGVGSTFWFTLPAPAGG